MKAYPFLNSLSHKCKAPAFAGAFLKKLGKLSGFVLFRYKSPIE
jgi:hypothetical protein